MFRDQTARHLESLEPTTRAAAVALVDALREAGVPAIITSSRRTFEEQRRLVIAGRSRTLRSKHLSGKAFDLDVYGWRRENLPAWFWAAVGPYAERIGLTWGGRWRSPWDPGHFESGED